MMIANDVPYHIKQTAGQYPNRAWDEYSFTESSKDAFNYTMNVYLEQGDWNQYEMQLGEDMFGELLITKLHYLHSPVRSAYKMFTGCSELVDVDCLKDVDFSNVHSADDMFANCSELKSVPDLNLSSCWNFGGTFLNCSSLESIGVIDMGGIVWEDYLPSGYATDMFRGCTNLKHIGGLKHVDISIGLSDCKNLTREAILNVFNSASYISNNDERDVTMYISSETNNLLSDNDRLILINKGWYLEF